MPEDPTPFDPTGCPVPDCDWHIAGPESIIDEPLYVLGANITHLSTHTPEERQAALFFTIDEMSRLLPSILNDLGAGPN